MQIKNPAKGRVSIQLSSNAGLSGNPLEGRAHATTGAATTALFRRDVNDRAVFVTIRNAGFNAIVARERVVTGIAFCPLAATGTWEAQRRHYFSFFLTHGKKRSSILFERIRTTIAINQI